MKGAKVQRIGGEKFVARAKRRRRARQGLHSSVTVNSRERHAPATPASSVAPGTTVEGEPERAPIWEKHVFVCTSGSWCPVVDGDGLGVHARLKKLVGEANLKDRVRVNHSGCFDQCGFGPMVVVYPENVWYWGVQPDDVEEIVREHLIGNKPVERLLYITTPGKHKLPRDDEQRPIGRPARRDA